MSYPIKNALKDNVLYKPDSGTFMLFNFLPSTDHTVQLFNLNDVPEQFRTNALITIKIQGKKIQSKMINGVITSKIDINKVLTIDIQPFSIAVINNILTIESTELLLPTIAVTGNLLFSKLSI